MVKYSTFLLFLLFLTIFLLPFFSTIPLPLLAFVYVHFSALPFPLLFAIIFQLHFLHSYCYEFQNLKKHITSSNNRKLLLTFISFFHVLKCHAVTFIFSYVCCLLINTWSSKLIRSINTSLCVLCTNMWKHLASPLSMNVANFIFWLLHIRNLPTLFVLIPFHSPYTPSIDYAHLSTDCENTSTDYINFFAYCAHNYEDCANTLDDQMNNSIDLINTPDISSLDRCIPNPTLL